MKVNAKKTVLQVTHKKMGQDMRVLGYFIDQNASTKANTKIIVRRAHAKISMLENLRKMGLDRKKLLGLIGQSYLWKERLR